MKTGKAQLPDLQVARRAAEEAVADMPEGDLKIKAFEVILQRLLSAEQPDMRIPATKEATPPTRRSRSRRSRPATGATQDKGLLSQRIMALKDDGFFRQQRTIGEVRQELKVGGWHYPVTTISPILLRLTQQRKLRREQVKSGNRKVWKYSNP
jgi:hypothetical protein